jgi:hypothetical protein
MPERIDLGNTQGGGSQNYLRGGIKSGTTQGSLTREQVSNVGQVEVALSDPNKTIQQSVGNLNAGFIGLGKGLVSIAENLPVIGGIAKPVIGLVGGIMDNTIGRGVSLLEQIRIGDSNLAQTAVKGLEVLGTPLAFGMNVIAAPGRWAEQRVAEARIINTRSGKKDFVTDIFGDAPRSALNSMQNGASIEEAATELADSNAGFSQDGAHNFLWSLLLDPINVIAPGVGKAAAIGSKASAFSKIVNADVISKIDAARAAGRVEDVQELADAQQFLEKWGWAGKVYDSSLGRLSNYTKRFASKPAVEAARAAYRVHSPKVMNAFLDQIVLRTGKSRDVAERGLRNFAVTAANATRSGVVRAVAAIKRSNSESFSKSSVSFIESELRKGRSVDDILSKPLEEGTMSLGELMAKSGFSPEDQQKLVGIIQRDLGKIRADELLRLDEVLTLRKKLSDGHANWVVRERAPAMKAIAKFREQLDAKMAGEEATRVLSESKAERLATAQNPVKAREELTQDLVGGFGMKQKDAEDMAEWVMKTYGNDLRAMQDVLSIARGANYGQALRTLAGIRAGLTGKLSRITIISKRSLTSAEAARLIKEVDAIKAELSAAEAAGDAAKVQLLKNTLKEYSDRIVNSYDDFAANFPAGKYTYEEVFDFLGKSNRKTVQEITEKELRQEAAKLPDGGAAILSVSSELERMGYRLGIAPQDEVISGTVLKGSEDGAEVWSDVLLPFSDTLDMEDISKLDAGLGKVRLRPSKIDSVVDKFTRPYGSEIIKANVAERFVTGLIKSTTKKDASGAVVAAGVSVNRARKILARVSGLAAAKNVQARGLFLERKEVEEIFREALSPAEYSALIESGSDGITEIIRASAGDWSAVGLTAGLSGRVKAIAPVITVLTDRIYPEVRFGRLNPYFNLVMERIETQFQLYTHNIRKALYDDYAGELRGTVASRAYMSPMNVNREFADGSIYLNKGAARNTIRAVYTAKTFQQRVINRIRIFKETFSKENLERLRSFDDVRIVKDAARDMTADRIATREIIDLLDQAAPGKLQELAIHYNVSKADDVIELLLGEYIMHSDPLLMARHIERYGKPARSFTSKAMVSGIADSLVQTKGLTRKNAIVEAQKIADDLANTVIGAYEVAIMRATREADKIQYFASHRTWLERSLNHPFLGLYPYSYMTQKAIPSMLKIMFLTPGRNGIVMPGLGYAKYEQVMEYMDNRMNSDSDVLDQILQSDALIWAVSNLFPANPESLGYTTPAFLRRHVIQEGLRGTALTPGALSPALSEVWATLGRGTAFGQVRTLVEGVQTIQDVSKVNPQLSEGIQQFAEGASETLQDRINQLRNP